jgi:hypothetical protein
MFSRDLTMARVRRCDVEPVEETGAAVRAGVATKRTEAGELSPSPRSRASAAATLGPLGYLSNEWRRAY